MPYGLDTIASKAVKAAATSTWVMHNGIRVRKPTNELAIEMKTYLGAFEIL